MFISCDFNATSKRILQDTITYNTLGLGRARHLPVGRSGNCLLSVFCFQVHNSHSLCISSTSQTSTQQHIQFPHTVPHSTQVKQYHTRNETTRSAAQRRGVDCCSVYIIYVRREQHYSEMASAFADTTNQINGLSIKSSSSLCAERSKSGLKVYSAAAAAEE